MMVLPVLAAAGAEVAAAVLLVLPPAVAGGLPVDLLLEPHAAVTSETASRAAAALTAVEAVLINSPCQTIDRG
jgi:hypothetical protein